MTKETIEAELMDARAQRDQQRQVLAQAQSAAQTANYNIGRLDGAEAAYLALLDKLAKDGSPAVASETQTN